MLQIPAVELDPGTQRDGIFLLLVIETDSKHPPVLCCNFATSAYDKVSATPDRIGEIMDEFSPSYFVTAVSPPLGRFSCSAQ